MKQEGKHAIFAKSFSALLSAVVASISLTSESEQGTEKVVRLLLEDINSKDKRASSWLLDPVELADESGERKTPEKKRPQEVIDLLSVAHWELKEFKRKAIEDENENSLAEVLFDVTLAGIPLKVKAQIEFIIKNNVPLVARFRLIKCDVDSSKLNDEEKKIDFRLLLIRTLEESQKASKETQK